MKTLASPAAARVASSRTCRIARLTSTSLDAAVDMSSIVWRSDRGAVMRDTGTPKYARFTAVRLSGGCDNTTDGLGFGSFPNSFVRWHKPPVFPSKRQTTFASPEVKSLLGMTRSSCF